MSGWDEGNVFYSDQGLPDDERRENDETLTKFAAQKRLKEFIRSFHDPQYNDRFVYRDSLQRNPHVLEIQLDDVIHKYLRKSPGEYLPLFESAAAEVAASLKTKVTGEGGEMEERIHGDVQVLLNSNEDPISIRQLTAEHISHLVKVRGIVIAASKTKAKATTITLMCKNCRNIRLIPCRPGLGGAMLPRTCDHQAHPGEEPCPLDPWIVMPDKGKFVDQQTLKLQENPENVPTGEMPRNLLLAVDRSLVQKIVPGTRVTVFGIFSIFQTGDKKNKNANALRQPYLRVVGMDHGGGESSRGAPTFTSEEETECKDFGRQPGAYERICNRISPSIFGHEDVKKAIACLLFGGSRKYLPDGVRLRGDINVLLLGDPSTAKSQFLKFVEKTAHIAVYTSGKGSSAAGLTASVIQDPNTREFYLEGGAMVLADGGVVCIDEFDKMRPEDRVAIHEAMEQQTISIAKAGITTVLNSRTSVLAAANPPSGRYDDLKTAQENIDLQTTILSRFDLIFIVKDARDYSRDLQIARHVLHVHVTGGAAQETDEIMEEKENWLKRYIEYCRHRCSPRLSAGAATLLQNNYIKIRQQMKKRSKETGENSAIPITVRQLEAIVRLSESLARMELSPVAAEEHVQEALRLFQVSTLDAAQSGITDNMVVTEEQRSEIQQVELQVRRRIGIGSFMSERRLIDELTRMNLNESIIRRALLVMISRDELEYRKERRVVFRKS